MTGGERFSFTARVWRYPRKKLADVREAESISEGDEVAAIIVV